MGRDAVVDSYAVLENDTALGRAPRLGGLSALAAGGACPRGEIWEGRRRGGRPAVEPLPPRPHAGRVRRLVQAVLLRRAGLAVAVLFFLPVFPSFMLIDWMDAQLWDLYESEAHPLLAFGLFFLLAIPASVLLVLATILLAAGGAAAVSAAPAAGAVLGRRPRLLPHWLLSRVLDNSLGVLHGLYASVFAAAWLRLMGGQGRPRCGGVDRHRDRARPADAGRTTTSSRTA